MTGFAAGVGFGMIISHTIFSLLLLKYYQEYISKSLGSSPIKGLGLDTEFLKGIYDVIGTFKKSTNKKEHSEKFCPNGTF